MKYIWMIMALLSGAFLPIQGGINARLGKEIASSVHAFLLSVIIGAVSLFIYTILTHQQVQLSGLKSAPLYLWSGGLFGAFYVTVIILAFPNYRSGPHVWVGSSRANDHLHITRPLQYTGSPTASG